MRIARIALALGLLACAGVSFAAEKEASVLDQKVKNIKGEEVDLADYKGKVLLIVNTASQCGYTPQYEGLQKLHEKYADQGLVVLGFPSNDFGKQEPGTDEEIAEFCTDTYKVAFPMFSKIVVKPGEGQSELYKQLTAEAEKPGPVKWNFEKFLISRDGKIAGRFPSAVAPEAKPLVSEIEEELSKK